MTDTGVVLRRAAADDKARIFEWRNLPEIVALSMSGRKVDWQEHQHWYATVMGSPDHAIFIVEQDDEKIGLVRFEKENGACDISIYLLPGREGKGRGSAAMRQAITAMKTECLSFVARIRHDNAKSIAFFSKHGFIRQKSENGILYYVLREAVNDAPATSKTS